jgi:hypothetical protein
LVRNIEVKQPAAVTPASYLNVSRNNIMLPSSNACTDTFKINSNINWTITVNGSNSSTIPAWLIVTPVTGSNNLVINMAATANTTNTMRVALVKVTSGTLVRNIEVKQPAAITPASYLYVSRNNIMLTSSNACTDTFKINSNVNWTVTVNGSNSSTIPAWLTVTPVTGSNNLVINMAATANTTNTMRVALVKVTSGTLVRNIEVKQPAAIIPIPFLNVNPNLFQFDASPTLTKSFIINSNSSWIITSDVNWLTYTPVNGNNNDTITVTASPNVSTQMRTAWIIVSVPGSLSRFIKVKQAGVPPNPIQQQLNEDNENEKNITIFPNPTLDFVTLFSEQDFSNSDFVEIYSIDGKNILKQTLSGNNVKIDIQTFKNGIYFLKIQQNNEVIIRTISKN